MVLAVHDNLRAETRVAALLALRRNVNEQDLLGSGVGCGDGSHTTGKTITHDDDIVIVVKLGSCVIGECNGGHTACCESGTSTSDEVPTRDGLHETPLSLTCSSACCLRGHQATCPTSLASVVPNVTRPQWASKGGEGDKSGRVQKRCLSRKNVLQAKKLAIVVGLGEAWLDLMKPDSHLSQPTSIHQVQ